jgi:hypothetical protein
VGAGKRRPERGRRKEAHTSCCELGLMVLTLMLTGRESFSAQFCGSIRRRGQGIRQKVKENQRAKPDRDQGRTKVYGWQ